MRRKTTAVQIGNLTLSSSHPVMVQSMLNTPTMDTEACVAQAIRIIEAGGSLVRITAQGVKEAENLKNIHAALRAKGYDAPLSADIHFTPDAALVAARYVEKVRINPGNFIDKRATFQKLTYTDEEYAGELEHIRQKFTEFLDVCREHHTAVRIGTNHGSLSDRIMSRYGNTPEGMVEATMEYLRICQSSGFTDVVISLKSSDCRVMVQAVRLLVKSMEKEGMEYPLHLGVTEAGEGEDGRIRSAVGIGTLLNEGLGDTIRVSLTEAPEAEIPVARMLVELCQQARYEKDTTPLAGNENRPVIVADLHGLQIIDEKISTRLGFITRNTNDPVYGKQLQAGIKAPEMIYTEALGPELTSLPATTKVIVPFSLIDLAHVYNRQAVPLCTPAQYLSLPPEREPEQALIELENPGELAALAGQLKNDTGAIIVFAFGTDYAAYQTAFRLKQQQNLSNPVILRVVSQDTSHSQAQLAIASRIGGFFLDRLAAGLWITIPALPYPEALELSRNILQSAGVRRYKTEFVSCPGCGRTLFDLQGSVAKVKAAFSHLNHLKIAVMGCVVNGPGEMGDADYGYVGAGNGKVNLYKGRERVKNAIPEQEAIEVLKELIMAHGDWKEK